MTASALSAAQALYRQEPWTRQIYSAGYITSPPANGVFVHLADGLTGVVNQLSPYPAKGYVTVRVVGEYDVLVHSGQSFADGALVYWDTDLNKAVAAKPTNGWKIGTYRSVTSETSQTGASRIRVVLNGVYAVQVSSSSIALTGVTGANTIQVPTNLADALSIVDDAAVDLMVFTTTTGAPAIAFSGTVTIASGKQLNTPKIAFNAATGSNLLTVVTNLADSLTLKDTNSISFLTVITTTATPSLAIKQNMSMLAGKYFDGGYGTYAGGLTGAKTALAKQFCYVTCADASNVFVTLPAPAAGRFIVVSNNSVQTADVYPYAAETIDNTTHKTVATYKSTLFHSDGTNWISLAGA